jgi:hypothetical protein
LIMRKMSFSSSTTISFMGRISDELLIIIFQK